MGHEIDVVDLKQPRVEKKIDTRPFYIPHGLVFKDDRLWFTAQGSKVVGVYNVKDDKVVQVLGTGQDFTHLIYLTPDSKSFYTTNVESSTISIFENKEIPPYMPPTGVLPMNAKPRVEWRQTLISVSTGSEVLMYLLMGKGFGLHNLMGIL
ncbi:MULTISPECIES: YncE family protein [Chitinophagaceae]